MSFWELFGAIASGSGVAVSILGAFLTYAARKNGEATRALIREMQAETRSLFERMDQRADERHREVVQLMERLRPS